MAGPHTPRAQARVQMLRDIKELAWRQVAADGAAALSLRGLARELGLVSSAIYRYYANRDELLTALIVDAYAELAATLEGADAELPSAAARTRWLVRCAALRDWARAEPSRFQLLYGSPVPGYQAPPDTVAPAVAVVLGLLRVLEAEPEPGPEQGREGGAEGRSTPMPAVLRGQLAEVAQGLELDVTPVRLARGVAAFAELLGLLVLELGGHFVGGFQPADALYAYAGEELADRLGLTQSMPERSTPCTR